MMEKMEREGEEREGEEREKIDMMKRKGERERR